MLKTSKMIILIESHFWWDYYYYYDNRKGYRKGTYLPLETIDDLVDHFNYVGFNDLCIYPSKKDMAVYDDPRSKDTKFI